MLTLKEYSSLVNEWINDLKFPLTPVGLYEPIKYMLGGGGKRLRPTLLCASANAYGVEPVLVKNQAIGIELFHNFTLLHDDVMDNADVRHGLPTVHCKWDERTAILSGDTMLTLASQYMGDSVTSLRDSVLQLFNKTAIEVYEGQQMDMNFETAQAISEADYIEMIRLKTSVLLGCATRTGAMLAGVNDYRADAIYEFATYMGIAFQLRDDYLDTFGDAATFGKAIGGDILNNKKTWLWVNAYNLDPVQTSTAYSINSDADKISAVTQLFVKLQCDIKCMQLVEAYTKLAIDKLGECELHPKAYDFFKELALKAINRTH